MTARKMFHFSQILVVKESHRFTSRRLRPFRLVPDIQECEILIATGRITGLST